jgi:hypothetical protein
MPDSLHDTLAGIEARTAVESLPLVVFHGPVDIPGRAVDVIVFDCPIPQEHGPSRRGELFVAVPAPADPTVPVPVLPAYINRAGTRVPGVPAWSAIGMSLISAEQALADARQNLSAAPSD